MNYIVTLRDGSAYKLDEVDGASLKEKWETSKQSFPADLGDATVLSSQFVSIAKEQLTAADWLTQDVIDATKQLEAKDRCRGQYSIQCEINNIAQAESKVVSDLNPGGRKWTQLIQDLDWREMVRRQLRAQQPEGWCDYRAGECACEQGYLSTKSRHPSLA